ncbi:Imm1 family immunity protein [Streptomyces sp. NPDC059445]|uniref:Imm1 family immunity protein n=1 Tax=Streptomyces sp. NPDC059445 TaxID=3346832 RepID=UPI0036BA610F
MKNKGIQVQFASTRDRRTVDVLRSADDVDSFVECLLNGPYDRNCAVVYSLDRPTLASGYYDHEFSVGVDRVVQMGALTFVEDVNHVSKGSIDRGILEYMLLGHVREFVPGSEISLELVRRGLKEFLENGGRIPTCIEWKEEEF